MTNQIASKLRVYNGISKSPTTGNFFIGIDKHITRADGTSCRIRKRKSLPVGTTQLEAEIAYQEFVDSFKGAVSTAKESNSDWNIYIDALVKNKKDWLHQTLRRAKYRDEKKGRTFNLYVPQVELILRRCNGRCEVTGMPFNYEKTSNSRTPPFSPSIDRIDSNKGYTMDNIRIVCVATNFAMSNWGAEVFDKLATQYVLNKSR